MKYTFEEIDRLEGLLEAEIRGLEFDPQAAFAAARRLVELCPDIAVTMGRVAERMQADYGVCISTRTSDPENVSC